MLTNSILSRTAPFTCKDVLNDETLRSLDVGEKEIKNALDRLRDNDYLEEIGYTYRIIPKEQSVRWRRR
jgi:hypothetical protein